MTLLPSALTKSPLQKAKDAYNGRNGDQALKLAAAMIEDDQWFGGQGWAGPMPRPKSGTDASNIALVTSQIKREFVSRNMLDNVVTRHVHGIAGRQPLQGVKLTRTLQEDEKPTKDEQKRINEFWSAYNDWWDNSGVWLETQQALKNAVWSGKGTLRLYIPKSKLKPFTNKDGTEGLGVPAGLTLAEALGYISVHAPEWNQAGVLRDGDRRVTSAYHHYTDEAKQERWELMERVKGEDGTTVTRVTPNATDSENDVYTDYPVSDLMIFEVSLSPLIKSSIITLSKFLNKTLTMGSRNINLGGFVERTIMNAEMPGKTVKGEDGKERFVPDAYEVGLGSTAYLTGLPIKRKDPDTGKVENTGGFTTPAVQYKDPIQWEPTFGKATDSIREMLFDEAKQLHVLITGDATANGVSRQQAVNDFMTSLEPTRMALEQLLRWLMNTVLSLGLHFTGRLAEWDAFTATAQARASAVQPTTPEIETALRVHETGLISERTTLSKMGVEDYDAEIVQREREGVTPAIAMKLIDKSPAWLGLEIMRMVWPGLKKVITDDKIQAHFEKETGGGQGAGAGAAAGTGQVIG